MTPARLVGIACAWAYRHHRWRLRRYLYRGVYLHTRHWQAIASETRRLSGGAGGRAPRCENRSHAAFYAVAVRRSAAYAIDAALVLDAHHVRYMDASGRSVLGRERPGVDTRCWCRVCHDAEHG